MAISTHISDERSQDQDRRPLLLVCNWSATDPVWDMVEDLSGVPWQPEGIRTELVEPSTDISAQAQYLADQLDQQGARALLLIGRTRHEGPARVQLRAEIPQENGQRLSHDGPGVVRSTAPAGQIIEAATKARVSIIASSENEADDGSRLLYEILSRLDERLETPSVALIRFPHSMPEAAIAHTVKSAIIVMTQHLSNAPRY
ncbi:hypothetical protein [Brevundimonas sp.]|uniref:hypothetical protein n=1 Tax=Brevundimonas sp. TaxID=1871086 RepID=UPI00289882D1|nr:hypothetical protein [Brevundimonas sp.]